MEKDLFEILETIFQLVLAAVLGGVIGYQREISDKPAGLRTHVLVSLGSALLMIVSIRPFEGVEFADVTRIASSVVTGIGFLGAGAIIRQGSIVRGLTTAASIWVVAGVGLGVGAGEYIAALAATLLILLTLTGLKYIELRAVPGHKTIHVATVNEPEALGRITSALGSMKVAVTTVEIEVIEEEGTNIVHLNLQIPQDVDHSEVLAKLVSLEGVNEVSWMNRSSL